MGDGSLAKEPSPFVSGFCSLFFPRLTIQKAVTTPFGAAHR